jgi:hypothetical protein
MVVGDERHDDRHTGHSLPSMRDLRGALLAGVVVGVLQLLSPFGFWWLTPATVYAIGLAFIAAVYIGFSVADGRPRVIVVECIVAGAFAVVAGAGVTGSAGILVAGYVGHAAKDFWQHRTRYVDNTRWWPPFCAMVDVVVAAGIAAALLAGAGLDG